MQWDGSPGAGFSSGKPWLPLNPDWRKVNVEAERGESSSLLSWYRDLVGLRRREAALRRGTISFLDAGKDVLAYERRDEASGRRIAVYLNFVARPRKVALGVELGVLLGSFRREGTEVGAGELVLGPCEVLIARILG
jgi:glycosidase